MNKVNKVVQDIEKVEKILRDLDLLHKIKESINRIKNINNLIENERLKFTNFSNDNEKAEKKIIELKSEIDSIVGQSINQGNDKDTIHSIRDFYRNSLPNLPTMHVAILMRKKKLGITD